MHPIQEAPGVYRLPVRTPFMKEPTNAYVLRDARVGLLDTGVNTREAWGDLCDGLKALGLTPEEVETVFISHAHVDHDGLAHRFPHAEVRVGARDLGKLVDVSGHLHDLVKSVTAQLPAWGVPPALLDSLRAPLRDLLGMSASVPWATALEGGAMVEGFGPPFRVLDLPGHSEGSIGLYREHDGVLLVGDHILENITPNPGLVMQPHAVTSGLGDYVDSLHAFDGLDVSLVLPGHGRSFPDLAARLESIRRHHAERLTEVERAPGEGLTLFGIVALMFPGVDSLNGFLALSEVFGYVEMLLAGGRLEVDEGRAGRGGGVVYRRAHTWDPDGDHTRVQS